MPRLQLTLLGGFYARIAGGPAIDIATRKTRALLAYLALPPGRQHTREALASLLWSDRGERQAQGSLRQALVELNRALKRAAGTPVIKYRDTLALDPESVEVDATIFEQLAAKIDIADLERAAAHYNGDLLQGLDVRDPACKEWLSIERQRFHSLAIAVLKRLGELQTGRRGIATAERLIALDPLQEEGYRTFMRLHAEAGELGVALRGYENCRQVLKRELDLTPSAETEALHQEIRAGRYRKALAEREVFSAATAAAQARLNDEGWSGKPSVAVLPFANLSGDPEQRYFSDGLSEDLITELSRFRSIAVIARNSSFLYRDKPVDVRQIGRELRADYIVEGSVRRAGERIRITAQLVEAASGKEVWAERYDRDLGDLFAVQDVVTKAIVGILPGRIEDAGARAAGRKRPENLSAYECYLRGRAYFREFDPATSAAARDLFYQAIALDPTLAPAYAQLAFVEMRDWWGHRSSRALDNAFVLAQKAVQLDENDGLCQLALGYVCLARHQLENAALHIHQALALNPNDSTGVIIKAELLAYLGEPNEALSRIDQAFRLNPFGPQFFHSTTSLVLFCSRDYIRSILSFGRITRGLASLWTCVYAIASYGYLDQREEAQAIIAHYHSLAPNLPLLEHASHEPFKHKADLDHLMDGLRKAGVQD